MKTEEETISLIRNRILAEYDKYGKEHTMDWAHIAAIKIYEGLSQFQKREEVNSFYCYDECIRNAAEDFETPKCKEQCEKCKAMTPNH